MKCETISSLVHIERDELKKLCMQVKETVATGAELPRKKSSFGITDLWNARKTMNTAGRRWSQRPVILSRL